MPARTLTREELLHLPAVVSVRVAASALGLGRNKAYELIHSGDFPCPVLRLGRGYRVPTAELLRTLGIVEHQVDDPDGNSEASPGRSHRASGSPHAGR